jgi:hypothetical protein
LHSSQFQPRWGGNCGGQNSNRNGFRSPQSLGPLGSRNHREPGLRHFPPRQPVRQRHQPAETCGSLPVCRETEWPEPGDVVKFASGGKLRTCPKSRLGERREAGIALPPPEPEMPGQVRKRAAFRRINAWRSSAAILHAPQKQATIYSRRAIPSIIVSKASPPMGEGLG